MPKRHQLTGTAFLLVLVVSNNLISLFRYVVAECLPWAENSTCNKKRENLFRKMDLNGNGLVSLTEVERLISCLSLPLLSILFFFCFLSVVVMSPRLQNVIPNIVLTRAFQAARNLNKVHSFLSLLVMGVCFILFFCVCVERGHVNTYHIIFAFQSYQARAPTHKNFDEWVDEAEFRMLLLYYLHHFPRFIFKAGLSYFTLQVHAPVSGAVGDV